MKRSLLLGLGTFFALAGVIWTLQGLDLLGQSGGMNGHRIWAVIGPITALIGLALVAIGVRLSKSSSHSPTKR
jgi:hypothetical protein